MFPEMACTNIDSRKEKGTREVGSDSLASGDSLHGHAEQIKDPISCPFCSKIKDGVRNAARHVRQAHNTVEATVEAECIKCGMRFKRNGTKEQHEHFGLCSKQCSKCFKVFRQAKDVTRHLREGPCVPPDKARRYKCPSTNPITTQRNHPKPEILKISDQRHFKTLHAVHSMSKQIRQVTEEILNYAMPLATIKVVHPLDDEWRTIRQSDNTHQSFISKVPSNLIRTKPTLPDLIQSI